MLKDRIGKMVNYHGTIYKGWHFYSEWEEEVDKHNKKLWHYVVDPDGKEQVATIGTSYTFPNQSDIHEYIDLLIAGTRAKETK